MTSNRWYFDPVTLTNTDILDSNLLDVFPHIPQLKRHYQVILCQVHKNYYEPVIQVMLTAYMN